MFLRTLLLWAVLVLALPWGAYAGGHGRFAAPSPSVTQHEVSEQVVTPKLFGVRRCHGTAVAGSSCPFDSVLLPSVPLSLAGPSGVRIWPAKTPPRKGITPLAMLDPPKQV
ncbi:hypothetical protein PAF17_08755 [Paracoccus sp. Z330]|uniref:DUF2946 domain-containing protein n=1 Tax=Paracoccus onchidii TaxID=3017813 RepID=A0ABT4ZE21_9RHOB|nr:hypothetical protein [Paracoccus onchidii]MDB6177603.1 hypothetical protein [Paracoccus onchidii]